MTRAIMSFPHDPSEWQDYADEHVLFIRALDQVSPSVFETVRIKRDSFGAADAVKYRHEVIFIDEYLADAARGTLNEILVGFGYRNLDDFVVQNATTDEFDVYDANGNLDRKNSLGDIIDLWLLASLIAESHGDAENDTAEITMSEADALALFERVTGVNSVKYVGGNAGDFFVPVTESKHISEVKAGDRVLYDGHVYTAHGDAYMTGTDYGREWNFEVESEDGPETYLYASYFENGIVNLAPNMVVRNAKCGDCTHHFCSNEGDPALELCGCEAKGWEDTDPAHPAWKTDCGRFCFEDGTNPCFEVTCRVDNGPWAYDVEPAGYIVVENCGPINEETAKEILKQLKAKRLLDASAITGQDVSYDYLGLRWWNPAAKDFMDLLSPVEMGTIN